MKSNKFTPRKNTAQAMVEFAIVLPILLLLLYGLLEAGRLLFMYSTIVTASRQAARYGSTTGEAQGFARY
jgi:Flp pilus assembly protein TadG